MVPICLTLFKPEAYPMFSHMLAKFHTLHICQDPTKLQNAKSNMYSDSIVDQRHTVKILPQSCLKIWTPKTTLMCLSIGTPKIINFPFVPNGKFIIFRCPKIQAEYSLIIMCMNIGTHKNHEFSFETNGKLMILGVPILKHFRIFISIWYKWEINGCRCVYT